MPDDILGWVIFSLIGFLVLILCGMVFYGIVYLLTPWGIERPYLARVKALSYKGSETTTGVGPAIGGNGGVAITSSTSSAQWNVVLKFEDGTVRVEDDENLFNDVEQDDRLYLYYRQKKVLGNDCFDLTHWKKIK